MPPSPLPPLAEFLRWLAETPAAFRAEPSLGGGSGTRVRAVVGDLLEATTAEGVEAGELQQFEAPAGAAIERNRLRWILAACHLLWHPALRERRLPRAGLLRFFHQDLASLASVASVEGLATEEERREELIRRVLGAAGLRLPGESERDAADRLTQVDSIERRNLIASAAEKQKRAKALQAELRRKAAQEAASKVSGE